MCAIVRARAAVASRRRLLRGRAARLAAVAAVSVAARRTTASVIVELGHRADGRARVRTDSLVDGDGGIRRMRSTAGCPCDRGTGCVRRERFDVAAAPSAYSGSNTSGISRRTPVTTPVPAAESRARFLRLFWRAPCTHAGVGMRFSPALAGDGWLIHVVEGSQVADRIVYRGCQGKFVSGGT